MGYEYRSEAIASKKFSAKQMAGTPRDLELDFDNIHVRVYKSGEQAGYFRCALAVPAHQDDEGYVLEVDFSDPFKAQELDHPREGTIKPFESDFDSGGVGFWDYYEAPLNDHDFGTLVHAMSARLSEKIEQGRKSLIFGLRISGTPFNGYVSIHPDLYRSRS